MFWQAEQNCLFVSQVKENKLYLEIIQTVAILILALVIYKKINPVVSLKPKSHDRRALLDSCALIDGRIVELAKAGFVPETLEIPEFIIAELQLLADGNDSQKRERARYGLEIVRELQQINGVTVKINRSKVSEAKLTDDKLVKLAKSIRADLYTTDFNLNQVANIEGVRVLNVNELAHALRSVGLPGETIDVKVIQLGSSRDQGVGYQDDGTMVVIDNARADIGSVVSAKITRSHQTVAGRMLFATKVGGGQPQRANKSRQQLVPRVRKEAPKIAKTLKAPVSKRVNQPARKAPASKRINSNQQQRMTRSEQSLFDAIDSSNN